MTLSWYVGLEVRLIEAREQAVRREWLEIGIDVLETILGIDEVVESVTRGIEVVAVVDGDDVQRSQQLRRQVETVAVVVGCHRGAVDLQ